VSSLHFSPHEWILLRIYITYNFFDKFFDYMNFQHKVWYSSIYKTLPKNSSARRVTKDQRNLAFQICLTWSSFEEEGQEVIELGTSETLYNGENKSLSQKTYLVITSSRSYWVQWRSFIHHFMRINPVIGISSFCEGASIRCLSVLFWFCFSSSSGNGHAENRRKTQAYHYKFQQTFHFEIVID